MKDVYEYIEKFRIERYMSKRQFGINLGKGKEWWGQNVRFKQELKLSDIKLMWNYYNMDINVLIKYLTK